MPHFLFKKPKTFSINFEEIENESASETPFWEIQRAEALKIITTFYSSWQTLWFATVRSLGDINLTEETRHELEFYENEQKKTVLSLLAKTLVAWEKDDKTAFSDAVLNLAKELRPSLTRFTSDDPNHTLSLTPGQLSRLQNYVKSEAISLKSAIEELQRLSWHKFEFGDKVLTESAAESLIREQLGLSFFDFLDFSEEPDFHAHGFFPSLLQDSADFGL